MKKILIVGALLAACSAASAQSPIIQSGSVTPGHAWKVITNGVAGDAGTAANGSLTSLGVTASGPALCQNSGPVTGPYNQLCFSPTGTGGGFSWFNYGGATGTPTFNINGTLYPFFGSGTGNVLGPSTTTPGCAAPWANTTGTLLGNSCALSISGNAVSMPGTLNIGDGSSTGVGIYGASTMPTQLDGAPLNFGVYASNYAWLQSFDSLPLILNPAGNLVEIGPDDGITEGINTFFKANSTEVVFSSYTTSNANAPILVCRNRNASAQSVCGIDFQTLNSAAAYVSSVQITGGIYSGSAGSENGDLDIGVYVAGIAHVIQAIRGDIPGTIPDIANAYDFGSSSLPYRNGYFKGLTLGTQQSVQGTLVLSNMAAGAYQTTFQSSNSATAPLTITWPVAPPGNNGDLISFTTAGVASFVTPTSTNTASTLVERDGSGNFSAGTIALTGLSVTIASITNAMLFGAWSGDTSYGCLSFNNTCTAGSEMGLFGGGGGDDTTFYIVSPGNIYMRPEGSSANAFQLTSTGLTLTGTLTVSGITTDSGAGGTFVCVKNGLLYIATAGVCT